MQHVRRALIPMIAVTALPAVLTVPKAEAAQMVVVYRGVVIPPEMKWHRIPDAQ